MTNDDRSLLLDYVSDDLTAEEFAALSRRLKAEPALADQLLRLAGHETRIVRFFARSAAELSLGAGISPIAAANGSAAMPSALDASAALRPQGRRRRNLFVLAGGLAAAAALFLALGLHDASEPAVANHEPVARVINESGDADWYTENRTHRDPSSLYRDDIVRLNAGSLRIFFEHGTSITLQAPAVLEVHSSMLARIHRGSIRVLVAKGAEGFSILTPIAKVVDLGTEFGVRVDQRGGTDVVVFQGAVDVEGRSSDKGPSRLSKRLKTGEAIRLDELGTASRVVTVPSGRFPRGGGGSLERAPTRRPPVILQVLDNMNRVDNFNFYEIVQAGMQEDALAFVDRPDHQWNGFDKAGIPQYLIGGDYVRTFNDDKLSADLAITVSLASPATIYILLDDRTEAPQWLRSEFEQSKEKIGLDRGIGRTGEFGPDGQPQWTQLPTGIGPGVSIDDSFTIWKRTIPKAGDVVLGPLRGQDWDTNMYGIVAVPLVR